MTESGHVSLIALVVVLVAFVVLAITVDPWLHRDADLHSQQFQQLTGGLGCGPSTDLAHCEYCFDPRLAAECSRDIGSVIGGRWFCPFHSCSIFPCGSTSNEGAMLDAKAD